MKLVVGAAIVATVVIVLELVALGIPKWIFEVVRKSPSDNAIYSLAPDTVIERCGAPSSDHTDTHPGPQNSTTLWRNMEYSTAAGIVAINFVRTTGPMTDERRVLNSMSGPANHGRIGTSKEKLAALPCLAEA
jgi:hypothetical protein